MKTLLSCLLFFLFSPLVLAQKHSFVNIENANDCKNAIEIFTDRLTQSTQSPKSYGQVMEFKNNDKKNLYYPVQEHNSVWYYFVAPQDGLLSFEITPQMPQDDYDFVLFSYSGTDFCKDMLSKKVRPVRSNLSKAENDGKTGLSAKSKEQYVRAGRGSAFSAAIKVRKGELFYLFLDKVNESEGGHSISFKYFEKQILVAGKVMEKDSKKNLRANIVLEDARTGRILAECLSDSLTGNFSLEIEANIQKSGRKLSIQAYKEGYFFFDTLFDAEQLGNLSKVKLLAQLPKIELGKAYTVENVSFGAASEQPSPESYYLYELMYKFFEMNKNIEAEIAGHTNGCPNGTLHSTKLSHKRAKNLMDFLLRKGIKARRLKAVGYGCSEMIYPEAEAMKDEYKAKINRRLEIRILNHENN